MATILRVEEADTEERQKTQAKMTDKGSKKDRCIEEKCRSDREKKEEREGPTPPSLPGVSMRFSTCGSLDPRP